MAIPLLRQFLFLWSLLINFFIGSGLGRLDGKRGRERYLLWAGIGFNIAAARLFQVHNFFLQTINALSDIRIEAVQPGLPFGYQLLYLPADCLSGGLLPQPGEGEEFPELRPVCHLFPAVDCRPHRPASGDDAPVCRKGRGGCSTGTILPSGVFVFGLGLFKKVIIADSFAQWADAGFSAAESLSFFEHGRRV